MVRRCHPDGLARLDRCEQDSIARYTVTVPDGDTRILMHFVVQRLAGDQAGAEAQALSLVNLTDPNMFFGLSATERAQVLNFRVP